MKSKRRRGTTIVPFKGSHPKCAMESKAKVDSTRHKAIKAQSQIPYKMKKERNTSLMSSKDLLNNQHTERKVQEKNQSTNTGATRTNNKIQTPSSKLQSPRFKLLAPNSMLQTPCSKLQTPNSTLQTPVHRKPKPDVLEDIIDQQ
jgi:hypothetical protein